MTGLGERMVLSGQRIKVVCIITSLTDDGPSNYLYYLLKYLDPERFDLQVICIQNPEIEKRITDLGIPVHSLGYMKFMDIRTLFGLRRLIRRIRPDIVHTILLRADLYGRLASIGTGAKVMSTVLNQDPYRQKSTFRDWCVTTLDTFLSRHFTELITVESTAVAEFNRQYQRIPRSRFAILPSLIDVPVDLPLKTYARAGGEGPVLVSAGRLHPQKGQFLMLEVLRRVKTTWPTVRLNLFGSGPLEQALRARAAELDLGEAVQFKGYSRNLFLDLADGDIFIMTSVHEGGAPIALLHAMAVGLPIVTTRVGGVEEFLSDQREGLLIDLLGQDAHQAEKLAEAVLALARDPDRAEAMGRQGKARLFQDFTAEKISQRYGLMCEELVSGRPLTCCLPPA